mmetsp:Transcript_45021/g.106948  ORF Transcript_45021/g.106948 Transcript_45021/m.106948 type:complete len:102 (+) Transcript_45021:993-1298(+)
MPWLAEFEQVPMAAPKGEASNLGDHLPMWTRLNGRETQGSMWLDQPKTEIALKRGSDEMTTLQPWCSDFTIIRGQCFAHCNCRVRLSFPCVDWRLELRTLL